MAAEVASVHREAVRQANALGLRVPSMEQIKAAERYAMGSTDYGAKWAYKVVDAMHTSTKAEESSAFWPTDRGNGMTELQRVARRTNLMWFWGGLAILLIALAGSLAIWVYPFVGPDMRTTFCAFLVPSGGFGLAATLMGLHDLRAAKKRDW